MYIYIYRRLGGESNREIVSCRACVRALWLPSEIGSQFGARTFSLFPFSDAMLSLFPCEI